MDCESNSRGLFERTIFEFYAREILDLQSVPDIGADGGNSVASVHKSVFLALQLKWVLEVRKLATVVVTGSPAK